MASKFTSLNQLPNLAIRTYKQGDRAGKRKLTAGRDDEIAQALSQCNNPSDVADFASQVGITDAEIAARASSASNFGNFRMTLGNRIRGILNVMEKAQKEGRTLTKKQAAAHGAGKQYADPKDLPPKKVRVAKPKAEKLAKVAKPKTTKKPAKAKVQRMVPPVIAS